ncbi:uncharacterized protein SPAPADRAFT_66869 [Spathaspora passalidarum NRRL Y-27907]|uniref:Uncharacterized protein n=1 Tax=Spathaspora passalidarum (strain NRRL Y-27907 / 11-Y1) TaxID=619300 RepID=G3APR1_SPAPN|nr:uncharacterized protein SPAPADRAFT_66869 [Spathaspora passalidarum NRRL Y-27907]EGW32232.1 hypothetical protein SPAPADRAFT_66869 [Spathaspora passalidarum NRRL Y-27907]
MLSMGVSLVCSNRCSSVVNRLLWHENMIITLGLRIIKVWKFDHDAKTNVLRGKNVILGNLINSNFIDACVLNDDEILVITNVNQLILLKLNSDVPKLYSLQGPEQEFGSLDYDQEKVWFGTSDYKITSLEISELKQIETASRSASPSRRVSLLSPSKELSIPVKPIIKVVNFSTDKLLVLNDDEQIKFIDKKSNAEIVLTQSIIKDLGGVSVHSNEFLAFSKQGMIKKIDKDLNVKDLLSFKLPSGTILANSMTAVEQFNDKLIIGDKYGGLYISKLENEEYTTIFQTKAHSSSINEIIAFTFEEIEMICSIGRDRMIQFFRNYQGKYELVETVPIHQGNLLKVIHHEGIIYVCSSDRTISVHSLYKSEDSVQMTHDKVITLKATPITMNILDDELIVSQSDKTVQIYNISEEIEFSRMVRFINSQTNEFIQIENFIKYEQYLIGWASDKSLRVFNYNGGSEISVVWGHSDSIVGLFMHGTKLVSIGSDGCLFTWSLQAPAVTPQRSEIETPSPIINKQVSRKILPKSQEKLASERRSPVRSPERRLSEKPSPLKPAKTLLPPAKIITRRSSTPNLSARLTAASISTPKLQSPLKSISPNKPVLSTPVLTKKPPHVVVNEVTSPVDGILNRLEDINKKVNLLSSGDRKIVGDKLVQMLESINQPHHQDMLEKYSDLLVDMVEKKLNMK